MAELRTHLLVDLLEKDKQEATAEIYIRDNHKHPIFSYLNKATVHEDPAKWEAGFRSFTTTMPLNSLFRQIFQDFLGLFHKKLCHEI